MPDNLEQNSVCLGEFSSVPPGLPKLPRQKAPRNQFQGCTRRSGCEQPKKVASQRVLHA